MSVSTKSFLAGLALVPLLGAISLAQAGTLKINDQACGTFTSATIDESGNITLSGVSNCTIGGGNTGGDGGNTGGDGGNTGGDGGNTGGDGGNTGGDGGNTGGDGGNTGGDGGNTGGDGGNTGGDGGNTGGGSPTGPEGIISTANGPVYVKNLTLAAGIPNIVEAASGLLNGVPYQSIAFRFTTGSFVGGSLGTVRFDGSSSNRQMSIHTEPGNQNSMGPGCNIRALRDATLHWSTTGNCRLQPNTTYYLNIKSLVTCQSINDMPACRFSLSGSSY